MKRKLAVIGMVLVLLLTVGCRRQTDAGDDWFHVGMSLYDESDVFIRALFTEFFAQIHGDSEGQLFDLEMNDAQNDALLQENQVERFINLSYDLLCVNLVDRTDAASVIKMADQADLPVIFFNRQPVDADMDLYEKAYYLGSDARESAYLQAQIVLDAWEADPASIDANGDGEVTYVILEGERGHQDTEIRTEYVVKALEEGGMKLCKAKGGSANFDRAQAENLMERWLGQDECEVELVLANNDEMALGAVEAIEACGAKDIAVVGIDGTDEAKQAVDEGRMLGTVVSDKATYAGALLQMIQTIAEGKEPADVMEYADGKYVWIPWEIYTQQ